MNTTMLEREPVAVGVLAEMTEFPTGGLEMAARELLGYDCLAKEVHRAREHVSVLQTLAELEIRPFTAQSVKAYKEACEHKVSRPLVLLADVAVGLGGLGTLVSLPVLAIAGLGGFVNVTFYAAVVFVVGFISLLVGTHFEARYLRQRKWEFHELASYSEPVPEFALQTAVDIKERHPEVKFSICTLKEERLVIDPFLVMRVEDNDKTHFYYLEVWNEPEFAGEREA